MAAINGRRVEPVDDSVDGQNPARVSESARFKNLWTFGGGRPKETSQRAAFSNPTQT